MTTTAEDKLNLTEEILYLLRVLGGQMAQHSELNTDVLHPPIQAARCCLQVALDMYARKYIPPERRQEFYTIAWAAEQDGEQEGRELVAARAKGAALEILDHLETAAGSRKGLCSEVV